MGQKRKDEKLYKEVGKRLSATFGKMPLPEVAKRLDNIVSAKTLWDYVNGFSMPRTAVFKKISEVFDVSADWLLKGTESDRPANEEERTMFKQMRQARTLGIAEEALEYVNYLIKKKESEIRKKRKE